MNLQHFGASMVQRQRHAVHGYVRLNYHADHIADDVINIIHNYIVYLIRIDSKILSLSEQSELLDLLHDQLAKQEEYESFKTINTKLLFRASDHDYDPRKFHQLCDDKGPTLTIIHNEYDRVFGAYVTKSFEANSQFDGSTDPNAFMFQIRPNICYYGLKPSEEPWRYRNNGAFAVRNRRESHYGPSFGKDDIWISENDCYRDKPLGTGGGCRDGTTFDFKGSELSGAPLTAEWTTYDFYGTPGYYYKVIEYEIFELECSTYYYKYI